MPAKPAWFPRIGSILAELRISKSDYLDRRAVERVFGVRQRRARQLMGGLPTLQIGNALAIPRTAQCCHADPRSERRKSAPLKLRNDGADQAKGR